MPKEITHWLIADAVRQRLAATQQPRALPSASTSHTSLDTRLDTRLNADLDATLVRLGATFHDVMYYVPRIKGYEPFFHVADILHGSRGEDTFELVRFLGEDIVKNSDKPSLQAALRSFLLGAVTHICTDSTFHPLIYWASGNWHGKNLFAAHRKHRILESAIDLHFTHATPNLSAIRAFSMPTMLHLAGKSIRAVSALVARHPYWQAWKLLGRKVCADAVWRGYANLAFARRWCHNPLGNALIRRFERLLPVRVQSLTALRYGYEFWGHSTLLHNQISYLHPVTGEPHHTSLAELFETAVRESVDLWGSIEADVNAGRIPLMSERGASLELGLKEVPARAMRYFWNEKETQKPTKHE
jgi:hypothetical protein